ncbi:MAG: M48 family metalloprotease [Thermoproteus sp. AZ2]|jgi:heat shock protein HtpX|uniref:M48 family metalloprotease n=1 Tax=Thermoproteus sp. AZ2 TaxID=1609232 RepID=A0ACC6V1I6_9CREN|nr:MAG: protease [Thermoproteus sp. AZ2]
MIPGYLWWWFDPVYWGTMTFGYILMFVLAATVAPKVANKLSGRFSLYVSMALLAVVLVSITAGAIWAALYLLGIAGVYEIPFIIGFVLILNIFTYFISPFIINLSYGAKPDPELQSIVDSVASRLGVEGRIKAVLVGGPPNAFSYGNFLTGKYVAVSRSLYNMLSRDELEAVVGHELGHHKHHDNLVMLLLGLFPSVVYFLGYSMIWQGIFGGRGERGGGGGGGLFFIVGIALVAVSFIEQLLVLAFSRMREYYADFAGALAAGRWSMQKALAKLHLYYEGREGAQDAVKSSKIKALFIYAFTSAYANPLYDVTPETVERIKRMKAGGLQEILSDHPPIPKRLRFLDTVSV